MTKTDTRHSAAHASFTIERTYPASPARVFKAFADPDAKALWFASPSVLKQDIRQCDFRVGGRERVRGTWPNGRVSDFDACYHDIVPNRRIVYSYGLLIDDKRISVSLATIELEPSGNGTRLVLTEQGAFLDGYDDAGQREQGTKGLLDALGASLKGA